MFGPLCILCSIVLVLLKYFFRFTRTSKRTAGQSVEDSENCAPKKLKSTEKTVMVTKEALKVSALRLKSHFYCFTEAE